MRQSPRENIDFKSNSLCRSSPRTLSQCLSTPSCTTRWPTPFTPWLMSTTTAARPGNESKIEQLRLLCILCLWYLSCFCPRLLAATTLRNVLGTMNLGEILSQRESIAREMRVRNSQVRDSNYCGSSVMYESSWMVSLHFEIIIIMFVDCLRRRWMMPQSPGESRWRG